MRGAKGELGWLPEPPPEPFYQAPADVPAFILENTGDVTEIFLIEAFDSQADSEPPGVGWDLVDPLDPTAPDAGPDAYVHRFAIFPDSFGCTFFAMPEGGSQILVSGLTSGASMGTFLEMDMPTTDDLPPQSHTLPMTVIAVAFP